MDKNNNTGYHNTGHWNTGDYNTSNHNSGDRNAGLYNSGRYNSGDWNAGNYNSGNYNTGNYNTGNYNTGKGNLGHRNTGYYNAGNSNTGCFNTITPPKLFFNKPVSNDVPIPSIYLPLTEWDEVSGKLITRTYKEAWAIAWSKASVKKKQQFLSLPNFDASIFKEITGIDVVEYNKSNCDGKVVEIDGKKYKLTEIT